MASRTTKSNDLQEIKQKIMEIKEDLSKIKNSPLASQPAALELSNQIKRLAVGIEKLIHIFEVAQEDIIKNYGGEHPAKKLQRIEDQNKLIAEGLLKLSDEIKGLKKEKQEIQPPIKENLQKEPPQTPPIQNDLPKLDQPKLPMNQPLMPMNNQPMNIDKDLQVPSISQQSMDMPLNPPTPAMPAVNQPQLPSMQGVQQPNSSMDLPDLPPINKPVEKKKSFFGFLKK